MERNGRSDGVGYKRRLQRGHSRRKDKPMCATQKQRILGHKNIRTHTLRRLYQITQHKEITQKKHVQYLQHNNKDQQIEVRNSLKHKN